MKAFEFFRRKIRSASLVDRGSAKVTSRLLNLGCGAHMHSDWMNIDVWPQSPEVMAHDLREPFPFLGETFDVVYHSHVLEHFSKSAASVFLEECHRVLKRGGILRVVVPDLETIVRLYIENLEAALDGNELASDRHEWMTLELLDQLVRERSGGAVTEFWARNPMPVQDFVVARTGQEVLRFLKSRQSNPHPYVPPPEPSVPEITEFRNGGEVHKWMYDRFSLKRLLTQVGFCDYSVCKANQSSILNFDSYHLDTNPDGSIRKPDSLFVEAIKV